MQRIERKKIFFMSIGYSVRGDVWVHLLLWLKTTEFFSLFSSKLLSQIPIPFHGDFLLLYSLLKLIRTLHLLTIWTLTWVSVPSDIHLIFLWVTLANVTLFACLLHINAAGKVASLHLMRQLWLPPRRLIFSSSFLLLGTYPYYQYLFKMTPYYG